MRLTKKDRNTILLDVESYLNEIEIEGKSSWEEERLAYRQRINELNLTIYRQSHLVFELQLEIKALRSVVQIESKHLSPEEQQALRVKENAELIRSHIDVD